MSAEEAAGFDIPLADRCAYIPLDAAKINIAARSGDAIWFKLLDVPIGNGTPEYPNGDTVQVAEPWSPPKAFTDVSSVLGKRSGLFVNDGKRP